MKYDVPAGVQHSTTIVYVQIIECSGEGGDSYGVIKRNEHGWARDTRGDVDRQPPPPLDFFKSNGGG